MAINDDTKLKIASLFYQRDLTGVAHLCAHPPRHHNKQELMHYCIQEALDRKWVNQPLFLSTLINRGLQLEYAEQGKTVLGLAICANHAELTAVILATGANPNHTDQNGYSPLSHAFSEHQNIDIIQSLLDAGANPLLPTKGLPIGDNAYEIAKFRADTCDYIDKMDTKKEKAIFNMIKQSILDHPHYETEATRAKIKEEIENKTSADHIRHISQKPINIKRRRK